MNNTEHLAQNYCARAKHPQIPFFCFLKEPSGSWHFLLAMKWDPCAKTRSSMSIMFIDSNAYVNNTAQNAAGKNHHFTAYCTGQPQSHKTWLLQTNKICQFNSQFSIKLGNMPSASAYTETKILL